MVSIFQYTLATLVALACAIPSFAQQKSFTITESGVAKAAIVISTDATISEQTAAKELSGYLQQITGAVFPIYSPGSAPAGIVRIMVGQSRESQKLLGNIDWKKFKFDGIVIKFVGKDLILAGDRPRGTLYAVYTFLEDYTGCRWWTPTAKHIPNKPTLSVSKRDRVYMPQFMYREVYFNTVNHINLDFASRLKLNGSHQSIPDEYGGHYTLLGFVHTFDTFLPAKDYFDSHPEWYSLINGKRVGGQEGQLCLTNEEMKAEFIKQTLKQIEKNESAGMISVSQNDNITPCQCDKCTAAAEKLGGQSGLLISFVNSVADEVAKKYPDFLVETLAYHYTRHAPTRIKPRDNVIVRLCTAECDFSAPLDSRVNNAFYKDLQDWKRICKRLYIWDYVVNFANLSVEFPNWKVLAPNMRVFAANNVIGMFEQGDVFNSDAAFGNMKLWLISHLMWDPALDAHKLMNEFANGYYGAAAPYLVKYLDMTSDEIRKSGDRLTYFFGAHFEYLKQEQMDAANDLFDKAEDSVKNNPEQLSRVRVARLAIDHEWILQPQLDRSKVGKFRGIDIKAVAENFINLSESTGNNYIGEGSRMTHYYYNSLRSLASLTSTPASNNKPLPPAAVKGLKSDQWVDIQDNKMFLYVPGLKSTIIGDKDASDQRAIRMPGNQLDWATQISLDKSHLKTGTKMDVYVSVKAKTKSTSGVAFTTGIYDDINGIRVLDKTVMIQDIPGNGYNEYKLGTYIPQPCWFIYVASPGDDKLSEEILVDRAFVIKNK